MALGRLITYFLSSSTFLLLLLLLLPLPHTHCSQLVSDAVHDVNVHFRNAKAMGKIPFICKTASCSVSSSRRALTISRKPFINPLVVTAVTLALCGCVIIAIFWILFAFLYLKSLSNQNASTAAASEEEDDFNDAYGIMSRRRIRTQNQPAESSVSCVDSRQLSY